MATPHDATETHGNITTASSTVVRDGLPAGSRAMTTGKRHDGANVVDAMVDAAAAVEAFDSPELRALKALKWTSGRALTAHVQDLALRDGKRAMVATSGGSFKKFVCSSETPCRWLVNAVRTRPRAKKKPRLSDDNDSDGGGDEQKDEEGSTSATATDHDVALRKYWYVSSAYLLHTNCTGMAKPTARQLKDVAALKQAVQHDTKISSAALVDQLKSQARLLCSKSMVYKAKIDLLDEIEDQEARDVTRESTSHAAGSSLRANTDMLLSAQRLPSYLAQLSMLNPDVLHTVERDPTSNAHFYRALVALEPVRFFSNATPLIFGVDSNQGRAATMGRGCTGNAELVLVGCDANLDTITFATALVPEANEEHFTWFLSKLIDCGYPLQLANGVYCDGRWAVTAACARVGIQSVIQDTRHLIDDLKQAITQQFTVYQHEQGLSVHDSLALSPDHLASIWAAQCAESEGDFYAALHKLEMSGVVLNHGAVPPQLVLDQGMVAAQHLRALDPRRWALFPRFATSRLYGWQTTRFAFNHQQDGSAQDYTDFFKTFTLKLMKEILQRHERAILWEREQRVVTPEAERLMQEEMKFVPLYEVAMSAPHIAFVWNPQDAPQFRQRRVDLQAKTCSCAVRLQFGVPCRHILSVLRKINGLGQSFDYFDDSLRVRGFVGAHKGRHVELPLDERVETDSTWLPAKHSMPSIPGDESFALAGSTVMSDVPGTTTTNQTNPPQARKRRARNKPAEDRKRALYKCRKCNIADGHNSLTCTNRRSKKNP